MSAILFGQSYYLRFDPKLWEAMQPFPPLGTLYAASYLRDKGYDVALFDAMLASSEAEWEEALVREQPRVAVLYEDNFNYLSKMCLLRMRQAAFTMIAAARARGCTVIVCGADATDHAEEYIQRGAQFVLLGEGEYTLGELMAQLNPPAPFEGVNDVAPPLHALPLIDGGGVRSIAGLAFADSGGCVVRTPRREDIKDLDSLPFPAWDLVDIDRYRALWTERHGYYAMNMVTTRGCPYHCNWCAKPIWGQRYNIRSPENVVAELAWLKAAFQPDQIWFVDDILGLKPQWLPRFADLIETQDARVPFKCLNRVDLLLREGSIEALRRAGCRIVWVGAESGSQRVLDAMEKGTRVEQIYEAARRLHAAGIAIGFFLQFGYPGETRDDIDLTLKMVRECRPDDIGMSVSYPLPGTKFHAAVQEQLGVQQNWIDSNDLAMLYRGPFTTAFYRKLHTVLHKEFRSHKTSDELRAVARTPWRLRRRHLRQAAAMVFHAATLPLERRELDRLAGMPHAPLQVTVPTLAPEAAAQPSPQTRQTG